MKTESLWHGMAELLRSPSGVFALLSLMAISIVTWKQPTVGGGAFIAFFPIVCALLTLAEHRETMQITAAGLAKEVIVDVKTNILGKS